MNIGLVDQGDVLDRAVVTSEQLHVVALDANSLIGDALVCRGDALGEETLPFGVTEDNGVQGLKLGAQVLDEFSFGRDRQVLIRLLLQKSDEFALEGRFGLVRVGASRVGNVLRHHSTFRRHRDRFVLAYCPLTHAGASSNVSSRSR